MTKSVLLAAISMAFVASGAFANPESAMEMAGCLACHAKDRKMVGPSFKEIAAKYRGQDVAATLMQKVRSGGKGSFGPIPLAPNPPEKIDDADLKAAVEFILKG